MKLSAALTALLLAVVAVEASSPHAPHQRVKRHARLASRGNSSKRCKPRPVTSSIAAVHTSAAAPAPPKANNAAHTSSAAPPPKSTPKVSSSGNGGVLNVGSDCGSPGGNEKVTATNGPNGNIDFLNCGINSGGWKPPFVHINEIKHVQLSDARHTAFSACSDSIVSKFEQYAGEFGIPSIVLASFAMQESSCNPATVGGAGEQGLMQLTKDKCGAAPGGNCKDLDYNIRTGAKFFSDTLNGNGGDVFMTVGNYNGWFPGMTYGDATKAAHTNCCRCQQNLDYLQQWANGWLQGINSYDTSKIRLGKYFNLDICGGPD